MTTVRVYCRMRPFNKRELALGDLQKPFQIGKQDVQIPSKDKNYAFDFNFDDSATQEQVFEVIGKAVVNDFMDGFNATQFVYGQTGAGKSWTMMGVKDDLQLSGIIPRSSALIFQTIETKPTGWKFEIEASYIEIYMERVNDLLNPDKQNLDVKESKEKGVYVNGLTIMPVGSLEDIYSIIDQGDKIRKVAATKMNAGSSRSHSVLSIMLVQTDPNGSRVCSQLNLVDLAGSERADKTGATGDVLKQGATINLSLTVLSQVISGLSDAAGLPPGKAAPVIPYRSSKLTRLLQTSLGGNAKTGLSIHISPHVDNLEESISTLEFGKRAKKIKNNAKAKVQRSAEQLEVELEQLQIAYNTLKSQFEAIANGGAPPPATATTTGGGGGDNSEEITKLRDELTREQAKLRDFEGDSSDLRAENDRLKDDIMRLEGALEEREKTLREAQRDFDVKDLEVRAMNTRMLELESTMNKLQGSHDAEPAKTQQTAPKEPAQPTQTPVLEEARFSAIKSAVFKGSVSKSSAEVDQLTTLVNQQKDMLNQVQAENKLLQQENDELAEKLEESTRRLALAELKVIRYETAHKRMDNGAKIAVKITPGGGKLLRPNPVWRALLSAVGTSADSAESQPVASTIDYEARRRGTILERFGGLYPVPTDQLCAGREGYLEERAYQNQQFTRKWFVLRDSMLCCYKDDATAAAYGAPEFCVPMSEGKAGTCPPQPGQEFCFMLLCGVHFSMLAAGTESERSVWVKDLNLARSLTHAALHQTACFNRCAVDAVQDPRDLEILRARVHHSTYKELGTLNYTLNYSNCGGMEGFLLSPGLTRTDIDEAESREGWQLHHVTVKDSHLLLYDTTPKIVTEPHVAFNLGGSSNSADDSAEEISVMKLHEESANPDNPQDGVMVRFYFSVVRGKWMVGLCAGSEVERERWMNVLRFAAKVTARNAFLAELDKEAICISANISPQERDLQDRPLDPLCVQPYDETQQPLYRHPDGRLVTKTLANVPPQAKRFSKTNHQLDCFNRVLPPGAVPMFTKNPTEPVGVGVDGSHYAYPSGRELLATDTHYDALGDPLDSAAVKAADAIVASLKVACIARAAANAAVIAKHDTQLYDAFGRPLTKTRDPQAPLKTVDGQTLGLSATVFDAMGCRVKFSPVVLKPGEDRKVLKMVAFNNNNKPVVIAVIGIEVAWTTLADVRDTILPAFPSKPSVFSFLYKGTPISQAEEPHRMAADSLPAVVVSVRDSNGNRMQFTQTIFDGYVDLPELDSERSKEGEMELAKLVSNKDKRRGSTTPRTARGK